MAADRIKRFLLASVGSAIPVAGWHVQGIKYAKKSIKLANGSMHTLKWIVKTNGIIDFGSRSYLRKVLGIAAGDLRQTHHVIPWELGEHALVQKAAHGNGAFHMNELLNGLPLEAIQHNGSHDMYNARVLQELNNILNKYGPNIDPMVARSEINSLINRIRTAIINNPTTPINNIVF